MAVAIPWLEARAAGSRSGPAETRLLTLLASPLACQYELSTALAAIPAASIPALLDRIAYHGLDGLAHHALAGSPEGGVHPWIRSVLKRRHQRCAAATMSQGLALAEVLQALHEVRLPVIVVGGMRAVETCYADPGARAVRRHDLLVRPGDREEAGSRLRRLGFESVAPGRYRRGGVTVALGVDDRPTRRSRGGAGWPLSPGALLDRATPGLVAGAPSQFPTIEDDTLLTALRLLRNTFEPLILVADLAHLVARGRTAICWETVGRRARASGLSRALSWSLEAVAMVGVPVRADLRLDPGAGLVERTLMARALELRPLPCTGPILMFLAAGGTGLSRTRGRAGPLRGELHYVS